MGLRTKRDPKLLRAFDVSMVLGRYIGAPSVEATARALSAYFRGGGRAIPYQMAIECAITALFGQETVAASRKLVMETAGKHSVVCLQVFDAIITKYAGRVSGLALIPSRLVGIANGIGIRMPFAVLTKVDSERRFILFQPRRGRGPRGDKVGFLLSMFNEKHAVDEEYGVESEILDMQCYPRSKARELRIVRSDVARRFTKEELDKSLGVYVAAMRRIVENPKNYGVSEDVSRDWHPEMDDYW